MKLKSLKPCNWFKKEDESEAGVPVTRSGDLLPADDFFERIRQDMDKVFENRLRDYRWPSLFGGN